MAKKKLLRDHNSAAGGKTEGPLTEVNRLLRDAKQMKKKQKKGFFLPDRSGFKSNPDLSTFLSIKTLSTITVTVVVIAVHGVCSLAALVHPRSLFSNAQSESHSDAHCSSNAFACCHMYNP